MAATLQVRLQQQALHLAAFGLLLALDLVQWRRPKRSSFHDSDRHTGQPCLRRGRIEQGVTPRGQSSQIDGLRLKSQASVKNFLRRRLRPAARRAAITTLDVDFQMLRRSFATLAGAISGGGAKSIQAQMGHARPDMWLLEYAQPVDEMRRRLLERMERILLGKEPVPVDLTAKLGSKLVN